MYWELRTVPHADLVGESEDLDALLRLARGCLDAGFPLDDLYICAEWDEHEARDHADLPAIISGAELVVRAQAADTSRQTAPT